MVNAQYLTRPSKISVSLRFDSGVALPSCTGTSLTLCEETHYLFIPSYLVPILPPLPFAGWPIWRSESRIVILAILGRPRHFFPLFLVLSTR